MLKMNISFELSSMNNWSSLLFYSELIQEIIIKNRRVKLIGSQRRKLMFHRKVIYYIAEY